jgi:hypothetical protein
MSAIAEVGLYEAVETRDYAKLGYVFSIHGLLRYKRT